MFRNVGCISNEVFYINFNFIYLQPSTFSEGLFIQ